MRGPDDLVASAAYQPEPAAAATARHFVRETLHSWDIAERARDAARLVDDAVLLTSELVTNAVVHAGTAFDVTCKLTSGELEVAVRDRHPARTLPDIPKAASVSAERGRGLLLPAALASCWGVTYAKTAKAVWFRISLARDEAEDSPVPGGIITAEPDAPGGRLTGPQAAGPRTPGPQAAATEAAEPGEAVAPDVPGEPGPGGPDGPGAPEVLVAAGTAGRAGDQNGSRGGGLSGADADRDAQRPAAAAPGSATRGPETREPGPEEPATHEPGPEEPGAREPGAREPGTDEPGTDEPSAPGPVPAAPVRPGRVPAVAGAEDPIPGLRPDLGTLSYDELLRHTVETARDVVTADAAYALVADEDGELRVRAAAGLGVSESLFAPSVPAVFADGAAAKSLVTVPFLVDGRVTGVLGAAATSADRFDGTDAARLQRVADRVAMSLERARLSELERKRRGRIGFLAEASDLLASTLDQEKTISLIAQLVVPRLAAWCAVLLAEDAGALRPSYVWHADESLIDPLAGLLAQAQPPNPTEAGVSWPLATAAVADLPEDAASLATDAAWCFPLAARGRSLGVVVIGRPRGDRPPREALELAEDLARRAALALDNARLYEQQQLTSQALQRSLLPPELPRIPGVDLAVAHEVAGEGNEVGGDFYDVFPAGENRWRFAIGDVCGTGPEAAAVTGLARHALRILAREGHDVADVVGRLNQLILEEGPRARFITLLHGEITVLGEGPRGGREDAGSPGRAGSPGATGSPGRKGSRGATGSAEGAEQPPSPRVRLRLVSAGHPLPLLLRAGEAASGPDAAGPDAAGPGALGLPRAAAEPQPLLGVMGDLSFGAQTVDLAQGDLMLCVTDGITERRDSGRLLDDDDGLARVLARCGGLNAGAVAARIQRAADDFGAGPRTDDMALLVLRAL
ncbi:MAG TPA: SpoIIE family protein phosphatase [Streptosporangiaceae bacterium]|nr:SpoIIE family protein phosphatase [Streptosporangiaceae bacterium]